MSRCIYPQLCITITHRNTIGARYFISQSCFMLCLCIVYVHAFNLTYQCKAIMFLDIQKGDE